MLGLRCNTELFARPHFYQHFHSLTRNDDDRALQRTFSAMHYRHALLKLPHGAVNWSECNSSTWFDLKHSATHIAYIDDMLCDVIGCHKYDTTDHAPYALIF